MRDTIRGVLLSGLVFGLMVWTGVALALSPEVTNLGADVNSPAADFAPIVSPDGNYLFFASDREGGQGGQDIWVAKKNDQGGWDRPVNLGLPINNSLNQGPDCFVSRGDDEYLYLTYCRSMEEGLCDIYVSKKNPDGSWGRPVMESGPINTEYSDANASWDQKNKVLYFTSTRPGGMSGDGPKLKQNSTSYDIWRARLQDDGSWGEAENLGSTVNTDKWEGVAFFHTGSGYLFFSSSGHKDADDADIYRTREVSPGVWSEPESVSLVNTTGNDTYFSIAAAGDLAYFAIDRLAGTDEGQGREDIYQVPIGLLLSPEDLRTQPGAGVLEIIYFDFDRSYIRDSERPKLEQFKKYLEDNPTAKVEIHGHACSMGTDDYNMKLSKRRADAVFDWLMKEKINPNRMVVTYYGESQPKEPNDPVTGNPINRRVELSIQ